MILKQVFEELSERGIYIKVALRKKALDLKLLDKEIDIDILKKIGIKDKKDQLIYLSSPIWTISGLGFDKAIELYNDGITAKDLIPSSKKFDELPIASQTHIIYKPMTKIPNKLIDDIISDFIPSKYKPDINYDIVGSYRRKTLFSGDIDILWYNYESIFNIDEFELYIYSKGPNKISGIFTLKNGKNVKIDIWIVEKPEYKGPMKLYSTGSKMFNIRQRVHAKKMGLKLNQEGLYDIHTNKRLKADTEEDIFKILKMKYLEPQKRN